MPGRQGDPAGVLRALRTRGLAVPNTDRVHVLMVNATGHGGIARTVNTLASQLVGQHEVVLHSVLRNREEPSYPIDPRVKVNWLIDNRVVDGHRSRPRHDPRAARRWRRLDSRRSALEASNPMLSALTDRLLRRALSELEPGVLVTTRPMLHLAATRWAPRHVLVIAQDHLNFPHRMDDPEVAAMLDEAVPKVDRFVTLTEADKLDYERRYPEAMVARIPNASPFPRGEKAPLDAKVVLSAGRLVEEKGFDRLIAAWAPLSADFPDWQLHIYGEGERRRALRRQIAALGVTDSVVLKGYSGDFDQVLAGAGIYAMGSRSEGFPMVLVEAMNHGLPLISFDCPRGPAEIIDDGRNGRLVPDGDVEGFTRALRGMLADEEARRRMGRASFDTATSYEISAVVAQWEQLFADTLALRSDPGR